MASVDWLGVETAFRAGNDSLRRIADEFGTSEGTIRRKAKQKGWIRDGTQIKREKVKAHFSGSPPPEVAHQKRAVTKAIEVAVHDDIRDMSLGLENARQALVIVQKTLHRIANDPDLSEHMAIDAKNLKALTETNKLNVELIRKIRGLDDPQTESATLGDDDLAILERYKHGCI